LQIVWQMASQALAFWWQNTAANRCILHGVLLPGLFFHPEDGSDISYINHSMCK
jgi:hypothetical protein